MFASERLSEHHDLENFQSGQQALDRWLKASAHDQAERRYSNTFVWSDGDVVVGYYTLLTHSVARESVPSKLGRGGPEVIPALLLAKLALDKSLHGQGLGSELLIDALSRCVAASDAGPGAKIVLVDAIDQNAREFYEHYGFNPVQPGSMTLYRKLAEIEAELYGGDD